MFDHIWFYVSFAHWYISTYLLHFNETQAATWSYFDLVCFWNIASPTSGLNPCTSPALQSPSIKLSRKGDVTDPTSSNFNSRIAHWDLGLIFPSSSLFSSDPCRQGLKQVTDLKYKPHDRFSRVERNMTKYKSPTCLMDSNGLVSMHHVQTKSMSATLWMSVAPFSSFAPCRYWIENTASLKMCEVPSNSIQFQHSHTFWQDWDPCTWRTSLTSRTSGPGRYKKIIRRLNPCKPFN